MTELRVSSRLVLAEALVHSLGGFDEEGLAALYEADEIARWQMAIALLWLERERRSATSTSFALATTVPSGG